MTQLIVVRHGRTEWNDTGRIQGASDIALDDVGVEQAARAADALASYQPDRIISSDLVRASDTAKRVAEVTGVEVELDERLRERSYGPWEGLRMSEISQRYPEDHERWRSGKPLKHPDIETWEALRKRSGGLVDELKSGDGVTLIFTHGGTARQIVGAALDWSQEDTGTLAGLDNVHWADIREMKSGRWRLFGYNLGIKDTSQLGMSRIVREQQK
ncbi:histidine phosphatase family protein [Haloglycomyces albus]|uniref:histidine phosphatase family protein n=1 Tax=Haloglycomyces albus TaxID=526067 RepID=UPI00046D24B0|nr:histidine phosphatase family protein [Haloglycomyces albus]